MTTAAQQTFLIVGAGLAGAKTAEAETVRALSKPRQAPARPGITPATGGDLVGVPEAYRDRTGNARICCLAGDLSRFS